MFKFITRRPFWLNLLVAIGLFIGLFILVLQLLGYFTNHGHQLTVPSVVSMKTPDAIKLLESKGFEVIVSDSVYVDTIRKGTVIKQIPDPNSKVKVNRTVLLIVNRVNPPLVDMPSLLGKNINFAIELLNRHHLVLGDTTFIIDFQKGNVLEQNVNGSPIAAGAKILWGSKVDLVIGRGLVGENMKVPDLIGMSYDSALVIIKQSGLINGAILPDSDVLDTGRSIIWRQRPPSRDELEQPVLIQPGQVIDLWLSNTLKKDTLNAKSKTEY
ncbi:MAG: PASTA domain-containing protein [Ferruginibacter sp.]|nr:PASTA domain-containing protein [Ferruginibacter sp.]